MLGLAANEDDTCMNTKGLDIVDNAERLCRKLLGYKREDVSNYIRIEFIILFLYINWVFSQIF